VLILILSKASRTILSMPSPHCSFATRARSTRIAARIALSQSCETATVAGKQTEHPVGSTTGQGVTGAARSSKIVRKAGTEKRAGSRVRGDPSNNSGGNGAGNKRYVIGCCICKRVS
jgi:DnaJ-class molecular chaperone